MNIPETIQQAIQHHEAGNLQQAEILYRKILAKHPDHPDALYLLGTLAHQIGRHQAAIEIINQAIIANPHNPDYHYNLGLVYVSLKQYHDAAKYFTATIKLKPDYEQAYNNLAVIQHQQRQYKAAYINYKKALQLDPYNADTHCNLGDVLKDLGQHEAALEHYQIALQQNPDDAMLRSNLLFLLSYNALYSPRDMLEAHQEWGRIHGGSTKAQTFTHSSTGNPDKCLRIGYVSPDLRNNVVSLFFEPILEKHDHRQVEIYCYAEVEQPDEVTQRLQAHSDHWRSTVGMTDEAVARLIFDDQIDILIDLAGHTSISSSRLKVFTYKPAPIQATYLGYCTTTGLAAMDYWITDQILHPEDTPGQGTGTVELATETIYRLPRCWLCYRPVDSTPVVVPRSDSDQLITFGSLNDLSKLTSKVVARWSEILHAVPRSRLLLKARTLADPGVQSELIAQFAEHMIKPDQLILLPYTSSHYLEVYNRIDIALDPFPRTGGGTTADALWMGVPVITLAGERFIERQGASMLTAVGLTELIANSQDDYVARAVALAKNRLQRTALRASLRERMAASPLCDAKGLTQSLESAYREMWKNYLEMSGEHHDDA